MTARGPRGRPSAHAGKNKARSFTLTMTDAGHDAAARGAEAAGMSRNDWIESVLLEADAARRPDAGKARCPHTWHASGQLRRCAGVVGHRGPHAWGASSDDRADPGGGTT